MPDVVEHGPEGEREGGRGAAARRVAPLIAVAVAALLLSRSGLLSGDPPERSGRPLGPTAPLAAEASRLVSLVDDHLVRLGQDDWSAGARLPGPAPSSLVPVLSGAGTGSVVGVHDGLLFRVATGRDAADSAWAPIGRARAVVAPATAPGRAVIWRERRVVEVDVSTGRVVEEAPFPGFDEIDGWSPEGLVAVTGTRALLMSRSLPGGTRQELALAWPSVRVNTRFNPAVQSLGDFGRLLGIAEGWVLAQETDCVGTGCPIEVVSVTRDDVLVRDVGPPDGWAFVRGRAPGRTNGALVPVRRDDNGAVALARLVPGGENALLVRGTEGVDLDAGLVDTPDGAVFLVTRPGAAGPAQVRGWSPELPGTAAAVGAGGGGGILPDTARLVCVCG